MKRGLFKFGQLAAPTSGRRVRQLVWGQARKPDSQDKERKLEGPQTRQNQCKGIERNNGPDAGKKSK